VLRQSDSDQALVVSAGPTLYEALKAIESLKSKGVNVRLIDLFSVSPIDRDGLLQSLCASNNKLLVVEDHFQHGGLGDVVNRALAGKP